MRKRFLTLLLTLGMAFSLTACGTKNTKEQAASETGDVATGNQNEVDTIAEDDSLQYILDKGTFIVGLDDTFPPMGFRDDANNIVGFDIDLAKAVSEKLGVEMELQPIEWSAKEQELATKNIDAIWNGFSVTEERLANLTMSAPYMENSISLVVTKDSGITSMAEMAGKKLAVQSGSSAQEALDSEANKAFKDTIDDVNEFASYITALMDLETGNSDAVLMDSVVANYMINDAGKDFAVLDESLVAEEYAIGFRKGEEALCDAINNALKELKADGTIETIATKWFGSDITTIE
ncbi:MAG: amino acid ABC transporter substrate-binding protein [Clostridiales bacterium]|nr:amino acid ABC transporter substrate-binding protein [Clostridiales bacterium]